MKREDGGGGGMEVNFFFCDYRIYFILSKSRDNMEHLLRYMESYKD